MERKQISQVRFEVNGSRGHYTLVTPDGKGGEEKHDVFSKANANLQAERALSRCLITEAQFEELSIRIEHSCLAKTPCILDYFFATREAQAQAEAERELAII